MMALPRIPWPAWRRLPILRAAALGLVTAALAACGRAPELPCPAAMVLKEADQVTKFAPGQPVAPQNAQYIGHIDQAKLNCSYDTNTYERMFVNLGVQITADKSPASSVKTADLEYFVAIVNLQGQLLARKEFPLHLDFPAGGTEVTKVDSIYQVVPLKYPQNGGSMQVWTGFVLSDAELQYNRSTRGGN